MPITLITLLISSCANIKFITFSEAETITKITNDSQFNPVITPKPVSDTLRNVQTFNPSTVPIAGDTKFGMDFAAS